MITSQSFQEAMNADIDFTLSRKQAESLAALVQETISKFETLSPAWKRWMDVLETIKKQHPEVIAKTYQGD